MRVLTTTVNGSHVAAAVSDDGRWAAYPPEHTRVFNSLFGLGDPRSRFGAAVASLNARVIQRDPSDDAADDVSPVVPDETLADSGVAVRDDEWLDLIGTVLAFLESLSPTANFDPLQPRDERGRWTTGGRALVAGRNRRVGEVSSLVARAKRGDVTPDEIEHLKTQLGFMTKSDLKLIIDTHKLNPPDRLKRDTVARLRDELDMVKGRRPILDRIKDYEFGQDLARKAAAQDDRRRELLTDFIRLRNDQESMYETYLNAKEQGNKKLAARIERDRAEQYKDLVVAETALNNHVKNQAQPIHDALLAADPIDVKFKDDGTTALQREAADWVFRRVGKTPGAGEMEVNAAVHPDHRRAYYLHTFREMAVTEDATRTTIVHELGHAVEFQLGAKKVAQEFLAARTAGEEVSAFTDVLPNWGYSPNERGTKDRFDKAFGDSGWYVGKRYDDGATEVISMGMERMYHDPASFAKLDPEYFAFVVGVMRGDLR